MKEIQLTQGKVTQVSDHRYEELNQWNWRARKSKSGKLYVYRTKGKWPNRKTFHLHREIMNPPDGMQVDHIDGNPLNNQDENLRLCTNTQNSVNKVKHKDNKSGYKGVYKRRSVWVARLYVNGKLVFYSSFPTPELAAKAYDQASLQYNGEFSRLNFPN